MLLPLAMGALGRPDRDPTALGVLLRLVHHQGLQGLDQLRMKPSRVTLWVEMEEEIVCNRP